MIITRRTVIIDDFEFGFDAGDTGLSNRGVSFDPCNVDVSSPAFVEALTEACSMFPDFCRIATLEVEHYGGYYRTPENMDQAEIDRLLKEVTFAEEHPEWEVKPEWLQDMRDYLTGRAIRKQDRRGTGYRVKAAPGYVYLIQSASGHYKIGRTADPKNRLRTFGVQLPFEIEFICLIETDNMHSLEQQLHNRYAEQRVNGEWFDLSSADVEYIKGLAS